MAAKPGPLAAMTNSSYSSTALRVDSQAGLMNMAVTQAPVVQWIEQRSPKPQIPVRIWAGAPVSLALGFVVTADFRDAVDKWADGFGTFAGAEAFGAGEFLQ